MAGEALILAAGVALVLAGVWGTRANPPAATAPTAADFYANLGDLNTMTSDAPLGIRNNNPGNIRFNGVTQWEGMTGVDSHGFITFDTPEHGIRALARVLINYRDKYGLRTVTQIISRWAPPIENDTAAYIADVAGVLGVDPGAPLDYATELPALVAAIIRHENGQQPYTTGTLLAGIAAEGTYA